MASTSDRSSASSNGSPATSKSTAAKQRHGRTGADGDTGEQPSNLQSAVYLAPRISPPVSGPASAANSTLSSREPSPVRLTPRVSNNNLKATARASRSNKSSTSPSPNRGAANAGTGVTTVPSSATAVQNAFSQLNKPDLQQPASVEPSLDVPGPEKTTMPPPPPRRTSDSSSRGTTSASRRRTSITSGACRSPEPGNSSRRSQQESTPANISTKRSSLAPPPDEIVLSPTKTNADDSDTGIRRAPGRNASGGGSTLETVEEASLPSTPMTDKTTKSQPDESQPPQQKTDEAVKQTVESGSESGGNKSSGKEENRLKVATTRPPGDVLPKRSFTSLNSARGKPGDGSVRNMIVETETVTSIPQVSLGVGAGDRGGSGRNDQGGTVRVKQSMETIRPKKEKKKTTRKPTSISGTASSKADIFEAKVASAVDEADVSDSDETFVYESNPPDPHPGRQHRYHSRTPSTTSMASQADQFVGRSRSGLRDGHGVTGKRSMKFTNNYNNLDGDAGDLEQGRGSGRGDSNGRYHHIGRHGRGGAYPSLFDSDSPFPQSQTQSRSSRHYISNGFRQNRRANNPRAYQNYRTMGSPKNMGDAYADDFDGDGADDERTPLVGSGRGLRSRNGRRPGSASLRQMEYLEQRQRNFFSRYGGCVIAAFLVFLLIGGAATLIIALTKPLLDVHVTKISNVLASEQEIMLDLNVNAINPNIFPIAIGSMDVNIFARSRFVGSEKFWRDHGQHPDHFPRVERSKQRAELAQIVRRAMSGFAESGVHATDGVDRGTDPIPEDPSGDAQTMLLGRVFEFDSPLIFDPSPWTHLPSSSVGGIRLARPGNKTEEGGTERWERVLQHPFELIVRGVVKYSLPLSSSVRSASISSKVEVNPDKDGDGDGDGDEDGGPHNDTVQINVRRLTSTKAGTLPLAASASAASAVSPVLFARMFSS
ncbi:hypothetical protein VTN77DRAFT_2526 [Rasamsonia byssochlamydoides]|uniref:uncharacterized protein n=1 Tax=Rasamsonia byssochlamydoides TaxID=89139 RepID=UPI0037425FEA